jgi:hypothetical protein
LLFLSSGLFSSQFLSYPSHSSLTSRSMWAVRSTLSLTSPTRRTHSRPP